MNFIRKAKFFVSSDVFQEDGRPVFEVKRTIQQDRDQVVITGDTGEITFQAQEIETLLAAIDEVMRAA
jgi:hypothetical protein